MTEQATLTQALERYQAGDYATAERLGRPLLRSMPRDPTLNAILGMVAAQTGRPGEAIPFLKVAVAAAPDNVPLRIGLGFALVNNGELDQARAVAAGSDVPQLARIAAFVDQQQGRHAAAIGGYRRVLAGFPEDAESWNNLGLVLTQTGDVGGAVDALERAMALRPQPDIVINLSRALARGERHDERQRLLRGAVRTMPNQAILLIELGLAEGAAGDLAASEAAYRRALALAPDLPASYLEYGMMLESLSRLDELQALVEQARKKAIDAPAIDFLEAWLLKRRGRFTEALALAERVRDGVDVSRHAQLLGDLWDRLGDAERAFGAFAEMNRLGAIGPAADFARSLDLPAAIRRMEDELAPQRLARWPHREGADDRPVPSFLVGFPRSGTTLLDTLLMAVPELEVLEEMPMVERCEAQLGAKPLSDINDADADRLRTTYFEALRGLRPDIGSGRQIVDKFPLHLARAPLIHRIFPRARFIMVERHPCDVVLSCFMARFQTNRASVHFHDLESAARLYDLAMRVWTQSVERLDLRPHVIRYERMVTDLAGEIRPLLSFLDVPWRDEVLDNQASAKRRAHVPTASYAQVTEPIYQRASGRWERYRSHLEPILPILAPWAERLGYRV
ncbi:tetratricopeptide repeat-containing sulfotransferase family protein [Sphingomonas sp.]|uniref:tetratricopeptide repeat-containing sulfotransferase family protein n=1 Tax=Sphingomonas sp. TaxID=28214 RepID=UPI003B3A99BA